MVLVLGLGRAAHADEQRAWVDSVPDQATWDHYSRALNADAFGKFIIDIKTDKIYFIDANLFELHADFVLGVLLKQAWTAENVREYNKNYEKVKPKFILGYITYHSKLDTWDFSFWEGDKIDAAGVLKVSKKLDQTFWKTKLPFRPDSPAQEKMSKEVAKKGLKVVTNDQIYKEAEYQAFNLGRAVGTLRIVPVGTPYEEMSFDRHDIVLLQESYPDITPVSGIIATTFSTPLSHVNLRAGAWGIPNAGDKKARDKWKDLDGKVVYYEVTDQKATIREATADEIQELQHRIDNVKKVTLPKADTTSARLAMLTRIRAKDVITYGTKTSNLGEIRTANLDGVNVPDGFGVPFFYYVRHLEQNELTAKVDAVLDDPQFKDAAWRKTALEGLRQAIKDAPIDDEVLSMIYKRVRLKLGGKGVFVRSSTNAEDLPGFNGAGLYDTMPNVKGKKALGEALKAVWASVWNLRAVDERDAFGIDHRQVFMGVMIQVGVAATASGVLVSTNLWDRRDTDGFTINAKKGLGMRVVEGQKVPEQIIFDATNDGTKIISRSDDPVMLVFDENGGIKELPIDPAAEVILTEERAKALVDQVRKFIPLFSRDHPLDVEWVLEGEKMWIVQARPFVGAR